MKIAFVTDDGNSISKHFGKAMYYSILTIENGTIVHSEIRPKTGHHNFVANDHVINAKSEPHGFNKSSQHRHARMATEINDCKVLICGGMGTGAHQSLLANGIQPIITKLENIHAAANAFLRNELVDHPELLH